MKGICYMEEIEESALYNYLSFIFHELKNPLTSVYSLNELLYLKLDQLNTEEVKIFLGKIKKQLIVLDKRMDETQDLLKIKSKKLVLKKEVVNIKELLLDVTTEAESNIDLKTKDESIYVHLDKLETKRALFYFFVLLEHYSKANTTMKIVSKKEKVVIKIQNLVNSIEKDIDVLLNNFYPEFLGNKKLENKMRSGFYICAFIVKLHGGEIKYNKRAGALEIYFPKK